MKTEKGTLIFTGERLTQEMIEANMKIEIIKMKNKYGIESGERVHYELEIDHNDIRHTFEGSGGGKLYYQAFYVLDDFEPVRDLFFEYFIDDKECFIKQVEEIFNNEIN